MTIEADASDNVGISRVSFYIDNEFRETKYSYPYEWIWDEKVFGLHSIKVIASDFDGNTASAEKTVCIIHI
ncbi:MAG: Ig-like domain-containing protein [Thermoplasmatales archaeon]|nr:Ig-like domain-containing protein [Thermoplasmatales archaeon]